MKFRRSLIVCGCLAVLVLLPSLLAETGETISVMVSSDQLEVEAPECLNLLFNRMTPVPVRMNNRTGKDIQLEIATRSDVVGLVPFRRQVAAGSNGETEQLVLIPLMAGEWDAELILTAGDRARTWTQRFCVLPPARLHARVHDAANRVVPARVRVTGADGRHYAPDGYGAGEFRTEGLFELLVPAGEATVSVRPADREGPARETRVDLPVNRTVFVELTLP
jgi:hypothetical protein